MLKARIIPILTFNGFALVKTKKFSNPRMVGNPVQSARVFNSRNVDELIFIDIFASQQKRKINLRVVEPVINECFMPVTIGGGITCIEDISNLMRIGADKVVIKTAALQKPEFIKEAVKIFGSQAIVIAVDVVTNDDDLHIHHFDTDIAGVDAIDFVKRMEDLGAGEICITDVHNDGMMIGFNSDLFSKVSENASVPIIASGGAGKTSHFAELMDNTSVSGIGAASIFYFTKYTPYDIKNKLKDHGHPVRIFDPHLSINTINT